MKKILATTVIFSALIFTGCNTVQGVGKDVSKAGDKVSEAAEKTKNKM